jgi:hypothetical protein
MMLVGWLPGFWSLVVGLLHGCQASWVLFLWWMPVGVAQWMLLSLG